MEVLLLCGRILNDNLDIATINMALFRLGASDAARTLHGVDKVTIWVKLITLAHVYWISLGRLAATQEFSHWGKHVLH